MVSEKNEYKFCLFISGMSVKSVRAIENLKQVTDEYLKNKCEVEIIDIIQDKEKAVQYEILAIPTLIKSQPGPRRTIIGDLSDKPKVLRILDLPVEE